MLETVLGLIGRGAVRFLVEWLRDRRRGRDLGRLGWQAAELQHLREVNNALTRMAAVEPRPARERLRGGAF